MKTFKRKFDFYATNVEVDEYVFGILKAETDPDDEIEVYIDRDIDNRHVSIKVFDRVLN